jgi:hypothetical protein
METQSVVVSNIAVCKERSGATRPPGTARVAVIDNDDLRTLGRVGCVGTNWEAVGVSNAILAGNGNAYGYRTAALKVMQCDFVRWTRRATVCNPAFFYIELAISATGVDGRQVAAPISANDIADGRAGETFDGRAGGAPRDDDRLADGHPRGVAGGSGLGLWAWDDAMEQKGGSTNKGNNAVVPGRFLIFHGGCFSSRW